MALQTSVPVDLAARYLARVPDYDHQKSQAKRRLELASKMRGSKKIIPTKHATGGLIQNTNSSYLAGKIATTSTLATNTYVPTINQMVAVYNNTSNTQSVRQWISTSVDAWMWDEMSSAVRGRGTTKLTRGREYLLPDGTRIKVDQQGNHVIEDEDARVIYRANRLREFNKYINASDLLEEFIAYLGTMGVRRVELADLPVSLFVNWLIIRAAEADGEDVPAEERAALEHGVTSEYARCLTCGSPIPENLRRVGSKFCSGQHMEDYASHGSQRTSSEQRPTLSDHAALVEQSGKC